MGAKGNCIRAVTVLGYDMKTLFIYLLASGWALAMSQPQKPPDKSPIPLLVTPASVVVTNAAAAPVESPPPPAQSPVDRPTVPLSGNPNETGPGIIIFHGTLAKTNAPGASETEPPSTTPRSGGGSEVIPGTSGYGSGR